MPRCKYCNDLYKPVRPMQPSGCCDKFECQASFASDYFQKQRKQREKSERIAAKEDRKTIRIKLETLKPLSYYRKKAQLVFNRWVRLVKCSGMPCISCGRHHTGQLHAGHYMNAGDHPELCMEPDNVWLQCQPCNTEKSGNLINYRKNLVQILGADRVEWLEGPHELLHRRKDDYLAIEAHYKQLLKEAGHK